MVVANRDINDDKKIRQIAGHFNDHGDVTVQCRAHCQMVHILSFTRSHWMPPLGKCLSRIVLVAAKVNKFVAKHKTLTKS